jgi:acyl carrier protein
MPANDEILEFLKDIILNISDIDASELQSSTPVAEIGLESLDFIEVQVNLRKKYGVELPSTAFAEGQITDLGSIVDYIQRQLTALQPLTE